MSASIDPLSAGVSSPEGLVSVYVGGQSFGVPVLAVQDVIAQTPINRVPLGPTQVAGLLNLRGRIVTAIDMRHRLLVAARQPEEGGMCVIVEHVGELYALLVDDVGDVLWLSPDRYEASPLTLRPAWRRICSGLYRLEDELLLVLNVEEVLRLEDDPAPWSAGRAVSRVVEAGAAAVADRQSHTLIGNRLEN